MSDRLTSLDASFLYLEQPTTPMHVGSVMVFDPGPGGPDHVALQRYVESRIAYVPRYRQRLRAVPARLANPVWVDDERFDIGYHVRRAALPRPGSTEQLEELVARIQARPLDRSRPLWELTLVEGLEGGRFAVVTKTHQVLVDGISAVDLGHVVLDTSPDPHLPPADLWRPAPEPSLVELVAGAVADSVRRPAELVETVRATAGDVGAAATAARDLLVGLVARSTQPATPRSPLNADVGPNRRFVTVETDLADYRRVRRRLAGRARRRAAAAPLDVSVNDVVLAVLAGGLRSWLLARGEPVPPGSLVRALVPVSVQPGDGDDPGPVGAGVSAIIVDLPTGEQSPVVRVHQVAYQTRAHVETGQAVDARTLAGIAGFAPPTLHALGVRVAGGLSHRLFNLVVTNVPGPQRPLYLAGARMVASFPVIPLGPGQALSVGLTSYVGGVCFGLTGDREAMADLDVLGHCVTEALVEIVEAVR